MMQINFILILVVFALPSINILNSNKYVNYILLRSGVLNFVSIKFSFFGTRFSLHSVLFHVSLNYILMNCFIYLIIEPPNIGYSFKKLTLVAKEFIIKIKNYIHSSLKNKINIYAIYLYSCIILVCTLGALFDVTSMSMITFSFAIATSLSKPLDNIKNKNYTKFSK
jgi:hypothetical protein